MTPTEWLRAISNVVTACATSYRKGEEVEKEKFGHIDVLTINTDPHESEAPRGDGIEIVDMVLITVAIDMAKATERRDELRALLLDFPDKELLRSGPSYIHLGAVLGDQGFALILMALGSVLGFWDLMTPYVLHVSPEQARQMAGNGFLFAVPHDEKTW
jgi:hypothetical protein